MQQSTSQVPPEQAPLTVFYDGACPLCQREISFYRRLSEDGSVRWTDVETADASHLSEGLTRDVALARFHVRSGDGELLSGARGFIALWAHIPCFQWLAKVAQVPPFPWLLELGYRAFLLLRPSLQRALRR